MTFTKFAKILKEKGFCKSEIIRLNKLGYDSAADAHADLKKDIPGNFYAFCADIGRDFVIDNLDDFTEMI